MVIYTFLHDKEVADFVIRMMKLDGIDYRLDKLTTIGVVDAATNELIAGLVYHSLDLRSGIIEISGAALPGKHWLTRNTIRIGLQYPFLVGGYQMVVMKVPADNERLLGMLAVSNFTFIPFPRLFGRTRDGVIACLTQEDWAASKICQRYQHHDAKLWGYVPWPTENMAA